MTEQVVVQEKMKFWRSRSRR